MNSRRFHFLRYFLLSLSVTIPAVTGISAYFMTDTFQRELLDEARGYATQLAENIYYNLEERYIRPALETGRTIDLVNEPEQFKEVKEIVDQATHGHRVETVYFFNDEGVVNYSTVPEHIGCSVPSTNVYFRTALSGEVASAIRQSGDPLDMTNAPSGSHLLETYVPVYSRLAEDPELPVGVVEIYQDLTAVANVFAQTREWVLWASLASMVVLGGILMVLAVKADRIIREREQEILRSNQALQELSKNLERQVRRRTSQLIHHEKLAGIGTLAAGVAHEINNPLATIMTCVDGSLERLNSRTDLDGELQQIKDYLKIVDGEVNRCKLITHNLLDFSRQNGAVAHEELDLNHLVERTVELVRLGGDAQLVDIQLDLQAMKDGVRGDPTQIREVVYNLLSNSLDAVANAEKPTILLLTRSTANETYLECVDNGPGIRDEIRNRVFEPFFTTKAAGVGTGLGLSLCYGIAQRHDGSCAVVEEQEPLDAACAIEPVGARVRFTLPRRFDGREGQESRNSHTKG